MPNTRGAAKRDRQSQKKNAANRKVRSTARTAVRKLLTAIGKKDKKNAATLYSEANVALAKAASKGAIPKNRAARKISRLTMLAKKNLPDALAKPAAAKK